MTTNTIPSTAFPRMPLPTRICNLDRVLHALKARGLDGIVATLPTNVFYMSGFNGIAHKSDEPRVCAVILSRHAPAHPVMVIADYYLATFLTQPSWIEDIRPFRAVMMPLDLPALRSDIDRFIPPTASGTPWIENARKQYAFDMGSALKNALRELKLDHAKVAFDDQGFGLRLGVEDLAVADGYDSMMFARAIKTPVELDLVRRATQLNEAAICKTDSLLAKRRHMARPQYRLRMLSGGTGRLRARSRRHGLGPSARHRPNHHACDGLQGQRG